MTPEKETPRSLLRLRGDFAERRLARIRQQVRDRHVGGADTSDDDLFLLHRLDAARAVERSRILEASLVPIEEQIAVIKRCIEWSDHQVNLGIQYAPKENVALRAVLAILLALGAKCPPSVSES